MVSNEFYDSLTDWFKENDPRTEHLPLMGNPWVLWSMLGAYLLFSCLIGPYLMKNRPAYECKRAMVIYNIFQIVANGALLLKVLHTYGADILACLKWDYHSTDPKLTTLAGLAYWFFIMKLVDWADTVFMVLRKKNEQISFLHLYHHTGMVPVAYVGSKHLVGGPIHFVGALNMLVHVVMYSYYLVSALNPEFKKSIWWKRRVTEVQMVQFFIICLHFSFYLLTSSCNFPKTPLLLGLILDFTISALFWNFYRKTYLQYSDKKIYNLEVIIIIIGFSMFSHYLFM